jgi:tetratricopeptide (TPR) repeat protein
LTTRHHGETEARAEGFEGRIEDVFEWITDHARKVVIGVVAFLVVGGAAGGMWEWTQRRAAVAQSDLAAVQITYNLAMGSSVRSVFVAEPANADQAVRAREEAVAGFEAVSGDYPGSVASSLAQIRAAELEIELGRADAAQTRLEAAAAELDADDLVRGVALRLRGYALEELERWDEAGIAYAAAAGVQGYPDRPSVWLSAAGSYARAGDADGAADAYQQILELDPAFAESQQVTERLNALGGAGLPGGAPEPSGLPTGEPAR